MNNHFNKRGRNNHQRRRQGVNPNRALDSNGPDVRIRGTAQQIYDKYLALARDATSSGDRVKAENYFQHAEHYFRVLRSIQGPQAAQSFDGAQDGEFDGADQPSIGGERGDQRDFRDQRQPQPQFEPDEAQTDAGADDQPLQAAPAGGEERAPDHRGQEGQARNGDFDSRRRRRRPRRHREDGAPADVGEDVEPAGA